MAQTGVMMVTGGYFLTIMVTWLLSMVGVRLPGLFSSGPLGMGLGLMAAALAAANLLLDFDMIKSAARARMPKWWVAWGRKGASEGLIGHCARVGPSGTFGAHIRSCPSGKWPGRKS